MKRNFYSLLLLLCFCTNSNAQDCSNNYIYVLKKLIGNVDNWQDENRNFICNASDNENFKINLNRIPENNVPVWLKNNSFCINFKLSFPLIESTHLLDNNEPIERDFIQKADYEIIVEKNYYGITFNDLKIGLNDKIITKLPQSEYYENYKRAIDENFFHGVKLKSTDGFVLGDHNFSAPLLLSILTKLGISFGQVDDEVEQQKCFFQFTFINDDTKAIMKVTYNNQILYYDFSDEPGRAKDLKSKNMGIIKKSL